MTTAIKVFLGFAFLLYPLVVLFTLNIRGEVDSLLGNFDLLTLMIVWFNLSIALLLAGIHNGIPWWSYLLAVFVIPVQIAGVFDALELLRVERVQWLTVVPILSPAVMAAYIAWACLPHVRAMLSPNLASGVAWCAVLALSIVPFPGANRLQARRRKERENWKLP